MSCRELVDHATAYLDGAMSPSDLAALEFHLRECDGCESYLDQFRRTIDALGGLREVGLDPSARTRLLKVLRGVQDARPV